MEGLALAVDLEGMIGDPRYSLILEEDGRIVFHGDNIGETEAWPMDSEPIEEFNTWDNNYRTAYLIGYMDARTEMPYLYDFTALDFQKCYELGRIHGEKDGILEEELEEDEGLGA